MRLSQVRALVPWRVGPARALIETLLLFSLMLLGLWSLRLELPIRIMLEGVLFLCIGSAFLCAVRMRIAQHQTIIVELLIQLTLGLVFAGTCLAFIQLSEEMTALPFATFPLIGRVIILGAAMFAYPAFRIGFYLWLMWDRLRRKHLIWSLTHAHLMVVVLISGIFIVIGAIPVISGGAASRLMAPPASPTISNVARLIISVMPLISVLCILTVTAMAVVLPPSAVFSYFVTRRTTRRLKTLTAATQAMRDHDYSVRIEVSGEDEVARLQTDFNAMADKLEQAVASLRAERDTITQLLQVRRDLAASVSHELRTPVATLRAALESAIEHETPPSLQELEAMSRDVIRLQDLIDDLFALSRAEVGQLTLRCQPVDIGEVVRRVVESSAPLAWRSSRVELIADVPEQLPRAQADPGRLEQILRNLLHNSLRHTPSGGVVTVSAGAEADKVLIEVWDTGEGISPEDLPHIWERFYRGQKMLDHDKPGLGLGLALVKELTELMHGSVAVDSTLGAGSHFILRLPRS